MATSAFAYTAFGQSLSEASRLRLPGIDSRPERWEREYLANLGRVRDLERLIQAKPNIVVMGSGSGLDPAALPRQQDGWLYAGVQWLAFHPDVQPDIVLSNHTCTLEAALRSPNSNHISFFIQSSGEAVPPIFERATSIQWGNINAMWNESAGIEVAAGIIRKQFQKRADSVLPLVMGQPNVLFILSALLIFLGAKRIVFAGVDPYNPTHFFTGRKDIQHTIVAAQCRADPWIAEWDGSSGRIPLLHRDSAHFVLENLKAVLSDAPSAIADKTRLKWFRDGFRIIELICANSGVQLNFSGRSEFLSEARIPAY
jgi:hypothetical protein